MLPWISLAIDFPSQPGSGLSTKLGIEQAITHVAEFLFFIVMSVSVLMFIWAGLIFITAQGDPTKIGIAKKMVFWGIIGIVVAILSTSVVVTVSSWL